MRPDSRSVSFTFHREVLSVKNSPEITKNSRNLRRRLQDRFEQEKTGDTCKGKMSKEKQQQPADRSWNNLSLGNMSADSRRALRSGAEKLSKTISSVRTTFGTISQKFKSSTRRRQRLEEQQSPNAKGKMQTPQTRSRQLLGRTPTKLYSPFGIESPRHAWDKENNDTPAHTPAGANSRWSTQQPVPQNSQQPAATLQQEAEKRKAGGALEQEYGEMTDQREQQPQPQQQHQQQAQQQQHHQSKGNDEPRTNLIINYLPQSMTEKDLYSLFVTIGPVESCRVMKDYKTGYSYGFGFVNYAKAEDAATAINTLNGLQVQNKRLKVSFARPSGEEIKETNLYVTNLPRNITESQIDDIFSKYGNIVQKNILKDKLTGLPRGVAFVRFDKREEAQEAIARLHGTIPDGGSEPLSVKIAEEHGKQKAAYYAGWQAGYNQSRGSGGGGLTGGGRGRGGASGPPGMGMGISGGGPGMIGRAGGGFGPRGGPHGNFIGGSGGPGAMRMEKIHPHRFNPIGMGGGYVQSHFW